MHQKDYVQLLHLQWQDKPEQFLQKPPVRQTFFHQPIKRIFQGKCRLSTFKSLMQKQMNSKMVINNLHCHICGT